VSSARIAPWPAGDSLDWSRSPRSKTTPDTRVGPSRGRLGYPPEGTFIYMIVAIFKVYVALATVATWLGVFVSLSPIAPHQVRTGGDDE
jgi:hypothetical protein